MSGTALALSGFSKRAEILAGTNNFSNLRAFGFGELAPSVAKNANETYLSLPKGFEYNVIGKVGSTMADGQKTPPAHDGMELFYVGREIRLVRNHEVAGGQCRGKASLSAKTIIMTNRRAAARQHCYQSENAGSRTRFCKFERNFDKLRGRKTPWGAGFPARKRRSVKPSEQRKRR